MIGNSAAMLAPHSVATPKEQHNASASVGQCRQASFNARAKLFISQCSLQVKSARRTPMSAVIANCVDPVGAEVATRRAARQFRNRCGRWQGVNARPRSRKYGVWSV